MQRSRVGGVLEDLGSSGHIIEGLHVSRRVADDALNSNGISLEYFRSFHVRHKEALLPHFARTLH